MTALEFGPPALPWSQNGYLLFNAVRTENLLLFSDSDLKTLFEHLRWLCSVDEPVGRAMLLNHSGPPVGAQRQEPV